MYVSVEPKEDDHTDHVTTYFEANYDKYCCKESA